MIPRGRTCSFHKQRKSLGQVVTDEKSNEITAIPKLLKMLETQSALVTIDAMGCQTEIAKTIVDAGADYCLAVKRNQPTLYAGIDAFFSPDFDNDFKDALPHTTEDL